MFHIRKTLFIGFLGICSFSTTIAQNQFEKKIEWKTKTVSTVDNLSTKTIATFDDASFDYRYNDLAHVLGKINGSFGSIRLTNEVYEEIKINLSSEQKALIKNEPIIEYGSVYEKKKEQLAYSIFPYRLNKNTNKYEVLTYYKIIAEPKSENKKQAPRTYASESVLRNGNWYKLGVNSTGIYKITYDNLVALGINPSNINPKNLRVYGNGGGMLPEDNSISRYDDLAENSIVVAGEEDGVFDRSDYILFYARGPINWFPDFNNKTFYHEQHVYSNEYYYFLTADLGPGKRILNAPTTSANPNIIINDYNTYLLHEINKSTGVNNTIKSGRERYGEEFSTLSEYSYNFNIPDVVNTKAMKLRFDLVGRTESPSTAQYKITYNGNLINTSTVFGVPYTYESPYGMIVNTGYINVSPSSNINLNIEYVRPNFSSLGYLNYITINAYRSLKLNSNEMSFRNFESVGPGNISQYNIETNDPQNTIVWDVTDKISPQRINTNINGNSINFKTESSSLKEYCAFAGNNFKSPSLIGRIENQNLHALGFYDFIIISHPDFISQAERLAEFRRTNDGLRTLTITPDKIYNEFGSGTQDASAIRDFLKMFYDRAGNNESNMPKYVLLFGDGSYDNIGVVNSNSNYIVTFESRNSTAPFGSYVSDDFFGLLDDIEGDWESSSPSYGSTALDLAVGRLPVRNALQASQMVDKIINYSNPNTFGDWRNKYVLIADDEDNNLHLRHAENHYNTILSRTKKMNIDKIYLDSYQQVSTPAGNRYPEVNAAFNQRANTGALVINYIGHGGENGLAHEKVLTFDDIATWNGYNNMPILMTATCSFSRWDDPAFQSAGEQTLLQAKGGAIALFTTTRIVYANENETINRIFLLSLFDSTNIGSTNTLGDIYRTTKNYNSVGLSIGQRNFTLLGDPSLPFALPKYNVTTDSVNGISVDNPILDTIKALKTITIKGSITDKNGNILNNLNGVIYPTVYDKKTNQRTLGQDRSGSSSTNFEVRRNVIYKGKASVVNGKFSYTFVVPKDISYTFGFGRLSYYAQLGSSDANGAFDSIYVGGSSNNIIADEQGPQMEIFINNENFAPKGITGDNPTLIVKMRDDNGINTVGNGIGHNITATLTSGTKSEKIDLNQFYEATLDSYQEGEVRYTFNKLNPGNYKLSVKAWDVVNNSSEISTEFTVIESKDFSIDRVMNYPNPFTTSTSFQFEHNRPGDDLQTMVQIYTISGKLVKTIIKNISSSGSRINDITWDGRDEYGDKLARGVYVYRMKVKASDGTIADKYEKLVILK